MTEPGGGGGGQHMDTRLFTASAEAGHGAKGLVQGRGRVRGPLRAEVSLRQAGQGTALIVRVRETREERARFQKVTDGFLGPSGLAQALTDGGGLQAGARGPPSVSHNAAS